MEEVVPAVDPATDYEWDKQKDRYISDGVIAMRRAACRHDDDGAAFLAKFEPHFCDPAISFHDAQSISQYTH